jgi:trigger factor
VAQSVVKATKERIADDRVKLSIEVDAAEVDRAIRKAYSTIAQRVKIDGFRKGKAPREVIDVKVGRETVLAEALERLVEDAYGKAVRLTGIDPIDSPTLNVEQFEEGKALLFTAEVEAVPDFDLPPLEGLTTEKKAVEVTEEEVANQLERLRERYAKLEPLTVRPAGKGDFALISFTGYVDGRESEKASMNDFLVELGAQTLMPEFENQLYGARPGDVKTFDVTFPPDHHEEEIAGKTVNFRLIVKELKQKALPELNDEFAKEVGSFESLEELKQLYRDRIREVKEAEAESIWQSEILNEYVDRVELTVPKKLVEREIDDMLYDLELRLAQQGVTLQAYFDATGKKLEDVKEELRPDAERRVKTRLVLQKIADEERVVVTEEDLNHEIEHIAERVAKTPKEVREILTERGELGLVLYDLMIRKAFLKFIENVKKLTEQTAKEVEASANNEEAPEAGSASESATPEEASVEGASDTASEEAQASDEEGM